MELELTVFELTMHFKHDMIVIWQRFQRNFELTVLELTVPDLYTNHTKATFQKFVTRKRLGKPGRKADLQLHYQSITVMKEVKN